MLSELEAICSRTWWRAVFWQRLEEMSFDEFMGGPAARNIVAGELSRGGWLRPRWWLPALAAKFLSAVPVLAYLSFAWGASADGRVRFRAIPLPLVGLMIAFAGNEVAGVVLAGDIYLLPRFRGRGIGPEIVLANYRKRFWRVLNPIGYTRAGYGNRLAAWRRVEAARSEAQASKDRASRDKVASDGN